MRSRFSILFVLLMLLGVAVPAVAAPANPVRVGDRISILSGDISIEANTPFHIAHGWGFELEGDTRTPHRAYSFELTVDGNPVESAFVALRDPDTYEAYTLVWQWVFDFTEGLPAGDYELRGTWYGRCQDFFEDCADKNESREYFTTEIVLTVEEGS